jgi:acyl-CoA synthetase (AMP-forming)/AMP-acid ligase II
VLVPNTEARIVDVATGEVLGPGRDGELHVRGPQVMQGYLGNPDATAATLDADGWLHTGDIARADEEGYFAIVDRLKELIKYKGYQVPPAELEAVLLAHPWPGNVRELQNVIAWMAVHSPRRGRVGPSSLPAQLAQATAPSAGTFEVAREEFERRFVRAALARAGGHRSRAADALGISRQGLAKMLRRLNIDTP